MRKEVKDNQFVKKPYYQGGDEALTKFINENLQYPPEALAAKVEGSVLVKYDVDYQGNVVAAKIQSGIGHGCDEEALRVVKLLKFVVPKQHYTLRVSFQKTIWIHFRLQKLTAEPPVQPDATGQQQSLQIQYSVTTSSDSKATPDKDSTGGGYHYTISW